jgi:alanine dehydrogenase
MTLLLREDEVAGLLDMPRVMDAVEGATRELGEGSAQNQPRRRVFPPGGVLNVMFASLPSAGFTGLKSYTVAAGGARFLVILYDLDGLPQALIEANRMGAYRTGAATGVAVKALAPPDPESVAIIGTGYQALTQAMAVSLAMQVKDMRVFGRDAGRRETFAEKVRTTTGAPARAVASAREAVEDADVVVTITTAAEPVLEAAWVRRGALVCACGSNMPTRSEIPPELVESAGVVVADQVEAAQLESGDLLKAGVDWSRVIGLGAVLAGKSRGRAWASDTVLFESHGLALWDVAAGATVLSAARERGAGQRIELFSAPA